MADDTSITAHPRAPLGGIATVVPAVKRLAALLDAPDPPAAVAALAVPELYELVTQVGFADTQELIELATPDQVRGCVDIDAWEGHALALPAIEPWLTALVALGPAKLTAAWEAFDPELRALLLQRHTYIYDLTLGEEPDDSDGAELLFTVDTFFCIKLLGDDAHNRLVRQIIDQLYMGDATLARETIMTARAVPVAELEDFGYRWRSGRMADLGFADYDEALEVFRPLAATDVSLSETTREVLDVASGADAAATPPTLPAIARAELHGALFFTRALDALLGEAPDRPSESAHFEAAAALLVNKILAAAKVRLSDADSVVRATRYAFATVSVGLEHLAQGDIPRAVQALRRVSLTRLHRLGFSLSLKLATYARALVPSAKLADDPTHRVLAALAGARPWMPMELDAPPRAGVRPFASQRDIAAAAQALARIALRIRLAQALGANLTQRGPGDVTLDDFARTALAHALLGAPAPTAQPLTARDFTELQRRFGQDRGIDAAALGDAAERLANVWRAADIEPTPLLDELMVRFASDLQELVLSAPDLNPRYVSGVLIDLP